MILDVVIQSGSDWFPALIGLFGALVGGLSAFGGVWLQQRETARQGALQFDRQRELAAEDHRRQVTADLNEELSSRIDEQLLCGDQHAKLMIRMSDFIKTTTDRDERMKHLSESARLLGMDFGELRERSISPDLMEDEQLARLVQEHGALSSDLGSAAVLADGRPELLPDDPWQSFQRLRDLRIKIELRRKQLQREGKPL